MDTKTQASADSPKRQSSPGGASPQHDTKQVVAEKLQTYGSQYVAEPARDLGSILRDYAHDKPDVAALWCFGIGLVVGWKLRG